MFKTFQYLRWIIVGLTAVVLFHGIIGNTAAKKWEIVSQLPTGRSAFSTAVVEGKIYVIGGRGRPSIAQNGPHLATIDVYDHGDRWRKKTDLLNLRYGFSTVVVDNEIYLIGGPEGIQLDEYVGTVEVYNPKYDRWRRRTPMPIGNTPFGAAVVNGKIYILGSERKNGEPSLDVEIFKAGRVTATDKLPVCWGELKAQDVTQP